MIFKQNITESLLLSLSNPVKSNIPKKGWESLIDSVVSGLYLVNCKTWKSKKKRDFFFFSLEQQGKNINWENPAPQSFSSYHARVLTDPPLYPDHECLGQPPTRGNKKARRKKIRESPHSCKWKLKLLWVRAKWVSTVTEHRMRCLVAPSQTWRQAELQASSHPWVLASVGETFHLSTMKCLLSREAPALPCT